MPAYTSPATAISRVKIKPIRSGQRYWVKGANSSSADSVAGAAAAGTGAAGAVFATSWANSHDGADRTADAMAT